MKVPVIRILIILLSLTSVVPAFAAKRQSCQICGMYIDQYQHTAAYLVDRQGNSEATCGVADMIRYIEDAGGPDAFSSIKVTDWISGNKVDAANATYVIGSDLVPDMIPNLIAFADKDAAEQFIGEHGGALLSFTQALLSISPMGMTMPTRINPAVLPPQGAAGIGVGYMYMDMDELMIGSDSVSIPEFRSRINNMMGPKSMTSKGEMYMLSYGITDNVAALVKFSYLQKEMVMQRFMTGQEIVTHTSGLTDTTVQLRYNLWKDNYYSKFISLLAGLTLPTGDYDDTYRSMPNLQLGIGTLGYYGGLLASARYGDFWFHGELSYFIRPENNDDYDFGDITKIGLAVHYTPNPDFMIGLETDYTDTQKNEFMDTDVDNSGGIRANVAVVGSWRFLTALGGNFNLKAAAGVPYYEDVNAYGLGGNYFANVMLSFNRRIIHNVT
ncbi:MAG: nitrous oxide reductase accessory protein NosL [Deltaproteobacteria bacterium]